MGASNFNCTSYGDNAQDAFSNAKKEAYWEHGHGGYSGSIAEKNTFIMITDQVFDTYELAYSYAEQLIDDEDYRIDSKHGPAGCIKFKDSNHIKYMFFGWARS